MASGGRKSPEDILRGLTSPARHLKRWRVGLSCVCGLRLGGLRPLLWIEPEQDDGAVAVAGGEVAAVVGHRHGAEHAGTWQPPLFFLLPRVDVPEKHAAAVADGDEGPFRIELHV